MQAALILTNATPDAARKYHLEKFPVTLGRGIDADVYIPDRLVSRHHCAIRAKEGTLVVEDLGSCNGTLVNGCHIQAAPLLPGDHLILGTHVFRIAYERTSLSPPPPIVYERPTEGSLHSQNTNPWP